MDRKIYSTFKACILMALVSLSLVVIVIASNFHNFMANILPVTDFSFDYIQGAALAILFHFVIFIVFGNRKEHNWLQFVWFIKVIIILLISLFYEAHYGVLDSFNYYLASLQEQSARLNVGEGTENLAIVMNKIKFLCGSSYHGFKVIFAFTGTVGLFFFYLGCNVFCGRKSDMLCFFCIMLVPSLLFWSSIVGKDPVNIMVDGLYFYGSSQLIVNRRKKFIPLLLASLAALLYVRPWLAYIFSLPAALTIIHCLFPPKKSGIKIVVSMVFGAIGIVLVSQRFGIAGLENLITIVQQFSASFGIGGSGRTYEEITGIQDLVWFVPWGMFSAVFRPLPGDVPNIFGFVAGLENLLLLLATVLVLLTAKMEKRMLPVMLWIVANISLWALSYAFVSPFNLGTGFRFRAQITPFLISLFILLYDRSKWAIMLKASRKKRASELPKESVHETPFVTQTFQYRFVRAPIIEQQKETYSDTWVGCVPEEKRSANTDRA